MASRDVVHPPTGPHFINVDLEVWSRSDLSALGQAVESAALVLYSGKSGRKYLVAFETKNARASTPEAVVWALLEVIGSLPPLARRAWKGADSRVFNVGYDAGDFVTPLHERPPGSGRWYAKDPRKAATRLVTTLSTELLRSVARVGGTITTTIYPFTKQVPARRTKRRSSGASGSPKRARRT
jgi:hypothetical protein